MTTLCEPVVLHIPGSALRDAAKLASFYGKIADGLRARGVAVNYVDYDRASTLARVNAQPGFHIIDRGRIQHPRTLNAGLGFIRPYYYLDPKGIRGFSSLADKSFDPSLIDPMAAAEFHSDLVQRVVLTRISRFAQPVTVVAIPAGCIAVFLQTEAHRDVAETCYLTLRHMIKALLARDDPRAIVVKLHPRDRDLATLDWLTGKARKDPRLQIIAANIHDILVACAVVVTINSAVGVEAMVHRKPVVLCGHADFHHCATMVRSREGMEAGIAAARATDWPYDGFLYWYFGQNAVSATSPQLVDDVLARIAATGFDVGRLGIFWRS